MTRQEALSRACIIRTGHVVRVVSKFDIRGDGSLGEPHRREFLTNKVTQRTSIGPRRDKDGNLYISTYYHKVVHDEQVPSISAAKRYVRELKRLALNPNILAITE